MNKATKGCVYAASCLAVFGALTLGQPRHVEAAVQSSPFAYQNQNSDGQLRLTSQYVRSAKSLQSSRGQNQINNSRWRNSMLAVTRQNWQNNHYQMSEQDQQRVVDPGNLTAAQNSELNNYAMGLLNQVRRQLGRPQLQTNNASQNFAKSVARNYVADGRDIHDHRGHDVAGIERAARGYGLDDHGQWYECLASGLTNYVESPTAVDYTDFYGRDGHSISADLNHLGAKAGQQTTMGALKSNIYMALEEMLFPTATHNEYGHMICLTSMGAASYRRSRNFYFGLSISKLYNGRYSIHFLIIPSQLIRNYRRFR